MITDTRDDLRQNNCIGKNLDSALEILFSNALHQLSNIYMDRASRIACWRLFLGALGFPLSYSLAIHFFPTSNPETRCLIKGTRSMQERSSTGSRLVLTYACTNSFFFASRAAFTIFGSAGTRSIRMPQAL